MNKEKIDIFIDFFMAAIMLCYSGPFASYKGSLVLIIILGIMLIIFNSTKIQIRKEFDIWKYLLVYLVLNSFVNLPYSMYYLLVCFVGYALMNRKYDFRDYKVVFCTIKAISTIEAFAILVQHFSPNVYYRFAEKWFFYSNQLQQVEYLGKYCKQLSGLFYEVSFAALVLSFGIILFFIDLFETTIKQKNIIPKIAIIIISYICIVFTGKRSFMIIIPIELMLIFVFKARKKLNWKKISLLLLGTMAVVLFYSKIETILNAVLSKGTNEGIELSGREKFWGVALQMFEKSPFIGTGLNSFDIMFNASGIRTTQYDFAGAHNSYIQLLGETGFIGLLLYISALFSIIAKGIKILLRGDIEVKYLSYSLGLLILLLLYAMSGNSLYQPQQLIAVFGMVSIIESINRNNMEIHEVT